MHRKALFATVLAIPFFCAVAAAQGVDDVVAKYVAARGGAEKMKALTTVTMTGTSVVGPGVTAPTVVRLKRPGATRVDVTVMDKQFVQATNGTAAWGINPFDGSTGPQAMSAEDTKAANEEADFDGPLVDYKAKGNTIEVVGKEPVDGADAIKLKVTLKSGRVVFIYLDATTFLERKSVGTRKLQGTEVEVESIASDYKPVEGVMFPFTVENKANGQTQFKMTVTSIDVNKPIEDSVFALPAQ